MIETAARIGAPSITVVEMMGVTPSLDEAEEAFAHVCDIAACHGLKAHIEFLPFGGISDLASAWGIVQAAGRPNGGLTLDSWHFFRSGSSFNLLAAIPGDRIHTVQINDAPAQASDDLLQETMTARLLPGKGGFDLAGFLRTLDATGCTALISVEIFSTALTEQPMGAVVVGTGFGLFTHVRALRDAGIEVRAIIGRNRERTAERAAPLDIPLASDNLEQVLADDPTIRLVTVATPPHAHYHPVMQAISAGRAVMCEKPFAKDLPQAREMLATAEKAGVVHALGAEFRFDSAQALLCRMVKDGMIGDPLMFSRIYQQPGGGEDEPLSD